MPGEYLVHADLVALPVPPGRVALGQHLDDDRLVLDMPGGQQRLAVMPQHLLDLSVEKCRADQVLAAIHHHDAAGDIRSER